MTSTRPSAFSESQRALLDQLLDGDDPTASPVDRAHRAAIPRRSSDGPPPLSFAQQRLWFLDRLAPGNPFYNCDVSVPIRGVLDVGALERTIAALVDRHESLRTHFADGADGPVQIIASQLEIPLRRIDRTGITSARREAEAQRIASDLGGEPFDLSAGPLFRTALVEFGPLDHLLIVTMHHIVCDGWSLGVLARELQQLYAATVSGRASDLADLPIQYADFAIWQRNWLSGERLTEQLDFWQQQLEDLPTLVLPTDRDRPALPTFRGGYERIHLPRPLAIGIQRLANEQQATVFIVLLAALSALLGRYSRSDDIPVGSPIANRNRSELEGLIGFFVNTLVMRVSLEGDPTFRELVDRVAATALDAYRHQDVPFERVVEQLAPDRDLSRNPLFQVIFQYFQTTRTPSESPLEAASDGFVETERGTSKFDLRLDTWAAEDGIRGQFEFSTDLFAPETIVQMSGHWRRLLRTVVDDPDVRLSAIELLSDVERDLVTRVWNESTTPYETDGGVHHVVERAARRRPDAIAVSHARRSLSAFELDRRAGDLAARLVEAGVRQGDTVGILLGRSIDHVVATLGVLRAGGVYVPLDPDSPPARLAFMLEDSGVHTVATESASAHLVTDDVAVVLCDGSDRRREQTTEPNHRASPDEPAYIMYTSGSTGTPKGIRVPHRGILRLVLGQRYLDITSDDVVVHASNVTFDASTFEIYGALCNGARLHIIDHEVALSPSGLAHELRSSAASVMFLTTPLFERVVEAVPDAFSTLRALIVGGSVLDPRPCRRMFDAGAPASFFNAYGPTENTAFSTIHRIDDPPESDRRIPIGVPISNSTTYILDSRSRPVPIGMPGELCVGGDGVALGYVNRDELTGERFDDDPFSATPGARLYRTGDLARYRRDGAIEFLGRIDDQVKIRGFRVEPGEIETQLRRHPLVGDAVVAMRGDETDDTRVVAYVRLRDDDTPADAEESSEAIIAHWRDLYDEVIYATESDPSEPPQDGTFDISGWRSTYTSLPIDADAMREQVDRTVERIARTSPPRVLEIGCGTGLLLFRLAHGVERYLATDLSTRALDQIEQHLDVLADAADRVELQQRAAHDFSDLPSGCFDAVVLNSVVQYFPSEDYLRDVIDGAIAATAPGGTVFVGDVRNLNLLEAFHTSVAIAQSPDSLSVGALRDRVVARVEQEQELIVAPEFFSELIDRHPDVAAVRIEQKRGRADHELTRFRYDVSIQIGGADQGSSAAVTPDDVESVAWRAGDDLEGALTHLLAGASTGLYVTGLPNQRLAVDAADMAWTLTADAGDAIGDRPTGVERTDAIHPEAVWDVAQRLDFDVVVCWTPEHEAQSFDALFVPLTGGRPPLVHAPVWPVRASTRYTSDPQRGRFMRNVVPTLRHHVTETLPDYMHPVAYVLVDDYPLLPSGKVDRTRLPAPDVLLRRDHHRFEAPRSDTEAAMVAITAEVLGVETIGIHDNFFTQGGGNSLLATQLVARVLRRFGVDLPLRDVFEQPTVAEMARVVDRLSTADGRQGFDDPPTISQARGRVVSVGAGDSTERIGP